MLRNYICLRLRAHGWTHAKINTFLKAFNLPEIVKVVHQEDKEVLVFGDRGVGVRIKHYA